MDDDALTVVIGTRADVEQQLGHLARGVLFVPLPEPPPQPLEELAVVVVAGPAVMDTWARVVQIVPPAGVALEVRAPAELRAALEGALARWDRDSGATFSQWGRPSDLRSAPAVTVEQVRTLDGVADDLAGMLEGTDEPHDAAEQDDHRSLAERLRTMSTGDKRQLALHGDKTARTLLLKDPNKSIHSFVIQNKGITLDEVLYIAGFRQANPDVLKQIGENREWMQNPRVVLALVGNPKTPAMVATKHLSRLPVAELRRIAKSQNVPRAVSAAARKMVIGE